MQQIERYGLFELTLPSGEAMATFRLDDKSRIIHGFHEGARAIIRFMPEEMGVWQYSTVAVDGSFECVPNTGTTHGPVHADGCHFRYADGTRCIPMGTTAYAWVHQTPELVAQTLETLGDAPFNKVRMCVFPKSMPFNNNEPIWFPFQKNADGGWDVSKPVPAFWRNLETNIAKLGELNIEADLILFHPYDRWGLSGMSREDNLAYLDYCVRRLGAYRNIWWSLANEYDLTFTKTLEDWDAFGEKVSEIDPYQHLIGVHNWIRIYPKRPWLTHVSIQKHDMTAAFHAREEYQLPTLDIASALMQS